MARRQPTRSAMLPGSTFVLLAACGFNHGALLADAAGDDDATDGTLADIAIDDPPAARLCNPADLDLRACYAFDGDTNDGSSYGNNANATGTAFVTGYRGQALQTSGTAVVNVPATTSLDISTMTLKMWIKPYSLPVGTARMGLLDSASRYRMFVQAFGALRCAFTGGADYTTAQGVITMGVWQRVACTYDGATLKIYVDGTMVGSQTYAGTLPMPGSGMVLGHNNPTGENFNGVIDEVQVWGSIVAP